MGEKEDAMTHEIMVSLKPFPQSNHKPVVEIIAPNDKSSYPLGSRVVYEIRVSDKEDGESKYGEISANEVLLKVEYSDHTGLPIEKNKRIQDNPPGLTGILTSNCLNCHVFKGKLIGPSFYEINKHYEPTRSNVQTMAIHIREGSSGVWGNTVMPSHPELSNQEIQEMVQWIMENAGETNIDYYTGTDGSIKLAPPVDSAKNASFILTANYTDHGVDGGQKLIGQDSVIIHSK